ncbi:MAG TPA: DUF924 family protein [Steroidobacteraceae bacterium]|jgi:uncharacterized protein (DUF924 family)
MQSTPRQPASSDWADDILHFWFEELGPERWFSKDQQLDERIRAQFLQTYEQLRSGVPGDATQTARGSLAAVIVLDQFPRNMFRNSPQSFATDILALSIAQQAIARSLDRELSDQQRTFLYLPFEHSEDRAMQARAVELFSVLGNANYLDYARRHKAVIDRFGRFPHRNVMLGRASSAEELEFLRQNPGF